MMDSLKNETLSQNDTGTMVIILSVSWETDAFPITYSVLISHCFALHPYEKHELIKPEWVITFDVDHVSH